MSVILKATKKQTASLIFLHGLGDTGHGWASIFEQEIRKSCIKYIFPTAPIQPVSLNRGQRMNSWFDVKDLNQDNTEDESGIRFASQTLINLAQEEITNGVPAAHIFVGGFSQGGAAALYAALTGPFKFAGVIGLSTWLPLQKHFPERMDKTRLNMPILQCQGENDDLVTLARAKKSNDFLKKLGFNQVDFKTYKGMGHSSSGEELLDIADFISKNTPCR